jgi:hypothetical protein
MDKLRCRQAEGTKSEGTTAFSTTDNIRTHYWKEQNNRRSRTPVSTPIQSFLSTTIISGLTIPINRRILDYKQKGNCRI